MDSESIMALRQCVGDTYVDLNPDQKYTQDWRHLFSGRPLALVRPASTEEVSAVMKVCHHYELAVVPIGGNTGLAGGATPDHSGTQVLLSLDRLKSIRSIDPYGETVTVEAGCIVEELQNYVRSHDFEFPVSFAAEGSAQVGGILATNAGGINVIRYGMTRHQVLGLEVVLANGDVINTLRRLRKDNAGLDLQNIFIGSEGCLGVITAAVFKLAPKMPYSATALLAFESIDCVLDLLKGARKNLGDTIQAFELMAGDALSLVEQHLHKKIPGQANHSAWYVLIEVASVFKEMPDRLNAWLEQLLEQNSIVDAVVAQSTQQQHQLWLLRESLTESEAREGISVKHDISVPIDTIPQFIHTTNEALRAVFPKNRVNVFGHMGDGNLHYNVVTYGLYDSLGVNQLVHDQVIRFEGSISAEHGIGQYRLNELYRTKSKTELLWSEAIKKTFDPHYLMNPGKVFLRY